ncbi:hypothetical protein IAT38_001444 [Cryptococcus sp. DSM 104549]
MSKIIVTGATGNAGSAVLTAAIASPNISHITVLARREPYETSPKVEFIQIPSSEYPKGFEELPPALIERLRGHTACVWAQGISQTQVNKEEYVKITHDYPLAAAKAFTALGTPAQPFKFIYMSGEGAKQDETGRALFSKIKGRTEKKLYEMRKPEFEVTSIRPGGIGATAEHVTRQHWFFGKALRYSFTAFKQVAPSMVIESSDLGMACVDLSVGKGWDLRDEEGVINNAKLKSMVV